MYKLPLPQGTVTFMFGLTPLNENKDIDGGVVQWEIIVDNELQFANATLSINETDDPIIKEVIGALP